MCESPGTSPTEAGRAYVFSGQTGSLLSTLTSPNEETWGWFGVSVSGRGDVNGDGRADPMVGAHNEDPGASPSGAGRAYIFAVDAPMILSGSVAGGVLVLQWTAWPGAAAYWVYGEEGEPYFSPGLAPGYEHRLAVLSPLFLSWSSPNGIGDPDSNWAYLVLAVDGSEQEMSRSNPVGEHDFPTGTCSAPHRLSSVR